MTKEQQQKIEDLTAQIAAQSARADVLETELAETKKRADSAEGALDAERQKVSALEKQRADDAAESPAKLKEQIRILSGKITRLEKERNDAQSPDRLRAAVKERVHLETNALIVLGGERSRFDEKSDRDLMCEVIEKLHGTQIPKERSDDYVRARFDAAIEGFKAGAAALERVRETSAPDKETPEDKERKDTRTAREKFLQEQNEAWKKKENK